MIVNQLLPVDDSRASSGTPPPLWLEALPVACAIVREDGVLVAVNAQFGRTIDLAPSVCIGRRIEELLDIGGAFSPRSGASARIVVAGKPVVLRCKPAPAGAGDSVIILESGDLHDPSSFEQLAAGTLDSGTASLVNALPICFACHEADGRYVFANLAYAARLGRDPGWFAGRVLGEVFNAETTERLERWFREAAHANPVRVEFELDSGDGSGSRQMAAQLLPEPGGTHAGRRIYALLEDLTARKQAEAAVARARWETAAIADNLPALVAYVDTDLRYRYVNRQFEHWYRKPASWFVGRKVKDVVGDAFLRTGPLLERAAAGEYQRFDYERINLLFDQPRRTIQVHLVPDLTAGEPRGFIALMEDVTDHRAADLAARRAESEIRAIIDAVPALVASFDMDARIEYANQRFAEWLGAESESLRGSRIVDVLPSHLNSAVLPALAAVRRGETVEMGETIRASAGSGKSRHYRMAYVPLFDADGQRGFAALGVDVTEQESQARALARNARRLAEAQRAGQLGLWELDVDSGSLYWSPELRALLELDDETEIGPDSYTRYIHPDDLTTVETAAAAALAGESGYDLEHRVRLDDGRIKHLQSQGRVERGADGRPARMVGLVRDITARKLAELALRDSEERLRQITETIDDVFWLIDFERPEATYVSPGFEHLFGPAADKNDCASVAWQAWVHEADRARVLEHFSRLSDGEAYAIEYRLKRRDGEIRWVFEKARPVPTSTGKSHLVAGLTTDITARKRTEMENDERGAVLRQITENTRDVFWLMDAVAGEIAYVSPRYARIWGYPPEQSNDAVPWLDRVHADDAALVRSARVEMLTRGTADFHYRIERPDGKLRWLHCRAFPVRGEQGELMRIVGFAEDETDTRSVTELKRLRDEAEDASRTKSEFLSKMSHELRTPLNAVLGFAQLMLLESETPLTSTQRESVEEIRAAGAHLLEIVGEMLDLSRIEMGKLRIAIEAVSIGEVITECISMVQSQAAARQIVLERPAQQMAAGILIEGDRTRVRQILLNLLSNAIKYNFDCGSVRIELDTSAPDEVIVLVHDTGPGLSAGQIEELFVPFHRIREDGEVGEGVGLGLALSKQLAEAMGGRIGAEAQPGRGGLFWLAMPASLGPSDEAGLSAGGGDST